eukprot:s3234_g17.t1
MVPQQWLVNTTAPGIAPDDRRRLDLVIYGAAPLGGALCCDVTFVSLLTHEPHRAAAAQDGTILGTATPSSLQAARKPCACSVATWTGGGTRTQCSWSGASLPSARTELRRLCEPLRKQRGPAAGGACSPWPSNKLLATQR